MRSRVVLELLKETLSSWSEDNAFRLSAALAYYAVFSLSPLLIMAIAIAGALFGNSGAPAEVIDQIRMLIGPIGAKAVVDLLRNATHFHGGAVSVLGVFSLAFGATGVFVSLQDGLNTVWGVKQKPRNLVVGFVRQRLHTLTLVLGIGFLLLVSLLASAVISAGAKYFNRELNMLEGADFLVSFGIITLLFAMIYKMLPDTRIRWKDVWIGAAATSLLFSWGKLLIGLYVGRSSFTSVYGAAGSLVLILAWVYYSSLILFLGAEFTRAYANRFGGRIVPTENAEPLLPEPPGNHARRPAA